MMIPASGRHRLFFIIIIIFFNRVRRDLHAYNIYVIIYLQLQVAQTAVVVTGITRGSGHDEMFIQHYYYRLITSYTYI